MSKPDIADRDLYSGLIRLHILHHAVEEPIFWQFVGLGNAKFGILEQFDTLTGRRVDNVGFFKVKEIDKVADADLYDQLLSEFPQWVRAATTAGILR